MTRQQSINAMCKNCIYDPIGGRGTWREQVAQCVSSKCPLWRYRPGPEGGPYQLDKNGNLIDGSNVHAVREPLRLVSGQ